MASNNLGEGVFVRIPQGREKEFWDVITGCGFEKNGDGIAEYVLTDDIQEDDEEDTPASLSFVKEWADQNPEQWEQIQKKGSQAIGSLSSWIINKIKK